MAKRGRPKKLQEIDFDQVKRYAQLGLTDEEIAYLLGIARSTLSLHKKENQKFSDTIKAGKLEADSNIVESLYHRALKGDTTAMIFWLKNRRVKDWRDKQEVEVTEGVKVIRDDT